MKGRTPPGGRPGVDWDEIRRRLREARARLEGALAPTPEEKQKVLRARARELAQEHAAGEARDGALEVVELYMAGDAYGIESRYVREVYPLRELTSLPGTPPFVLGVVNVRGQIVSVVDLRRFFGLPETPMGQSSKLLVVRNDATEFGVLADEIGSVRAVAPAEVLPPLPTLAAGRAEYLIGVTVERLVLLDAEKILNDRKLTVHEEA